MNVLLDTCTFLWLISEPTKLSATATTELHDPNNRCWMSIVSTWELALAISMGRISLTQPVESFVPAQRLLHRVDLLPLTEAAAFQLPRLPTIHKDPFDRMLVCQGIVEAMTILTPDSNIHKYPVKTSW